MAFAALAVSPTAAAALTVHEVGGLNAPANGIVLGPDGNVWAAETTAGTVVRMTPAGQVLNRYPVGLQPTSMATGPGGRVWVSVTGADKLVWFDATAASPSAHEVSTGVGCGPVGIVAGDDGRMYVSMPEEGVLCGESRVGYVKDDGSPGLTAVTSLGEAFDLAVGSGKVFIPDYEDDVVRRVSLGSLSTEAEIELPAGSGPQGIAVDGAGDVWVTLSSIGKLARFPASLASGEKAPLLTPTGGSLSNPFGIVSAADGSMYVASAGNAKLLAATATPSYTFISLPFDAEPWQLVNGPSGDLWVTDRANPRLLHLSNDPGPGGSGPNGGGGQGGSKPKLSLSGKKKQKLGQFVKLTASCGPVACTVSATGTLRLPALATPKSPAKQLKLKQAKVHVAAGRSATLKLKLPAKAREAATAALEAGKEPVVKVKARAADGSGSSSGAKVRQVTVKS